MLVPHLARFDVWVSPFIVRTKRDRVTGRVIGRGGGHWSDWARDLKRLMLSQPSADVRFSTLFDFYGLPEDFPHRDDAVSEATTAGRLARLETAMADALSDWRLIPYLQLHEFEAYVFADLHVLESLLDEHDRPRLGRLASEVAELDPEGINDGQTTSPSKRLSAHLGAVYQKLVHGPLSRR